MPKMKMFIDTHDTKHSTFPQNVTQKQFQEVFSKFEKACEDHDVVTYHAMLSLAAGRMFCVNLAKDVAAVEAAHNKIGLPYDSITEVATASPRDLGEKE